MDANGQGSARTNFDARADVRFYFFCNVPEERVNSRVLAPFTLCVGALHFDEESPC
jgi:hypothetical protein